MRSLTTVTLALLGLTGCITDETEPTEPNGIRETGYLSCAPAPDACGDQAVQCLGPDGAADCVATPACLGAPDCACAGNLCGELTCFDQPAGGFRCGPSADPDGGADLDFGVDAAPDFSMDLDGGQRPDRQVRDMDPFAPDSSTVVCTDNLNARDCVATPAGCLWDGEACQFTWEAAGAVVANPESMAFGAIPVGNAVTQTVTITNTADFADVAALWLTVQMSPPDAALTVAAYTDDPDSPLAVFEAEDLAERATLPLDFGLAAGRSVFFDITVRPTAAGAQRHTLLLSNDDQGFSVMVDVPFTAE